MANVIEFIPDASIKDLVERIRGGAISELVLIYRESDTNQLVVEPFHEMQDTQIAMHLMYGFLDMLENYGSPPCEDED